jgi:D-alanine-D-alanine ligase
MPSDWARQWARCRDALERFRAFMQGSVEPASTPSWHSKWIRPKGNLSRGELTLLLAVAALPLLMVVVRISALPGVLSPGMVGSLLPSIGHDLNEVLSLEGVPPGDRNRVLYMLFLPTFAMLIALVRLTLGVRMIGFRAILISVGFQASGIVPSVILIAVVVAIVVLVRPTLVRIRLPYVARVSVIMSISVMVLLAALLIAPWTRSEVLWRVAFFPVIVLGLLAEGIAKTLDRDSGMIAISRTGMTIGIALLLAGIGQVPLLREIAIQFPELVLTQVVGIILISEFLDHRLFQDWDSKLSGMAVPRLFSSETGLRVAIVGNQRKSGVIGRMGSPSRNGYSRRCVRQIGAALQKSGHTVKVFEGDLSLLSKLREFIPAHPRTGQPGGLVLNLSHGIQGQIPVVQVPAMLEMAGVAYTGPGPLGAVLGLDKPTTASLLREAGVATPQWRLATSPDELQGLHYPVVVKPRHESRYKLRVAKDREQLQQALQLVTRRDGQAAIVEELISGREIQVPMLGNGTVECLPLVEAKPGKDERACPAPLDADLAQQIRDAATAAFHACGCRDYALVNVRVTPEGKPYVLGVDTVGIFARGGAFELAAEARGESFAELIERIVEVACERYRADAFDTILEPASKRNETQPRERRPALAR